MYLIIIDYINKKDINLNLVNKEIEINQKLSKPDILFKKY